jgi:hypothetical protein
VDNDVPVASLAVTISIDSLSISNPIPCRMGCKYSNIKNASNELLILIIPCSQLDSIVIAKFDLSSHCCHIRLSNK